MDSDDGLLDEFGLAAEKRAPGTKDPSAREIKHAIRFQNGMVMVFDQNDAQVGELQGRYEEVRERVLAAATSGTLFIHASFYPTESELVSSEQW